VVADPALLSDASALSGPSLPVPLSPVSADGSLAPVDGSLPGDDPGDVPNDPPMPLLSAPDAHATAVNAMTTVHRVASPRSSTLPTHPLTLRQSTTGSHGARWRRK
jgi:hypothetical protein